MQHSAHPTPSTTGPWSFHYKESITLGIPLIGAQLAQMLIHTTDIIMLGWLGTEELAAGVLATQTFFILYIFGAGICLASMPLASQAAGRNDPTGVRRVTRMACWVATIFGMATMPVLWFIEPILLGLGQEPRLAKLADDYMIVALWGMIPALLVSALKSFYSAVQRANLLLIASIAGTLLNILLNYAFIFGNFGAPRLEIVGAAVASVGTTVFMTVLLMVLPKLLSGFEKYDLYTRIWKADWPKFWEIVKLGFPIGIAIVAEVGLFIAASIMMGWIGVIELAAHGIAIQLASIAFMIPLGLSNVATVRVGQAYGAGQHENVWRAALSVSVISIVVGVLAAILLWAVPELFVGWFLDEVNPDSGQVAAIAATLVLVAAAFQLADGLQAIVSGCLRGMSDTKIPMLMAIVSYWIPGIGTSWLLAFWFDMGAVGIWIGLAVGLTVAAVVLSFRFLALSRRTTG